MRVVDGAELGAVIPSKASWAWRISRPSTSKRSGLAARFVASWIATTRPSRTPSMPQHSFGKITPRVRDDALEQRGIDPHYLGLESGALVLVVVARTRR